MDAEIAAYKAHTQPSSNGALALIPKETLVVPGLVGKSPTMAKICESPILESLRSTILTDRFRVLREGMQDLGPCSNINVHMYPLYVFP